MVGWQTDRQNGRIDCTGGWTNRLNGRTNRLNIRTDGNAGKLADDADNTCGTAMATFYRSIASPICSSSGSSPVLMNEFYKPTTIFMR